MTSTVLALLERAGLPADDLMTRGGTLAALVQELHRRTPLTLARTGQQPTFNQAKAREDAARHGPPSESAARRITAALGLDLHGGGLYPASLVMHYGPALSWSPLYVVLRRTRRVNHLTAGLVTWAAMSLIADETMTPLLWLSAPNRAYPLVTHLRGFVAHLVFGLAVAATTEAAWAVRGRP